MNNLFKTIEGKKEIFELYNSKMKSLNIEFEELNIATKFGMTRVLKTGNENNPPLVIVHGSNACAPISLETYPNLHRHFQVFAVDVVGQPNKSETNTLNMNSNEHGLWLNEVILKLKIDNVILVGFSLGGLIILKALLEDPVKIKNAYLASPAFIVNGNPLKALLKIFIPMKMYVFTKKRKYIKKFLGNLFSQKDEFAINYLSKVFLNFKMDFTQVPEIKAKEARTINTPIALFAAENDVLFPGVKMIEKAKKLFPNLTKTVLFENSNHVQNAKQNTQIENLIIQENASLKV